MVGKWLDTVVENWLLPFPRANPAMTQMFRDRDRYSPRELMPWSGEFAGKYLLGALGVWQLTRDQRLWETIERMISEMLEAQAPDGYLGPFPEETRLTGNNWDLWGHYHVMYALLGYHEITNCQAALQAACRAADLICTTFAPGKARILHGAQMNMGIVHGLTLLYRHTGEQRYLDEVQWLITDSDIPGGIQFMRTFRQGKRFHEFPEAACRWEVLHFVQGLAELYWLTGEDQYRQVVTHVWENIRDRDRHNTGGFSTAERAIGTPYQVSLEDPLKAAIETCCTVAWCALSVDMLRMTGDSAVADELELALHNAVHGSMHPSGCWWSYNTPMDGRRLSSAHQIVFQAHVGGPELNCCHANAHRPLGMVRDWAVMTSSEGLVLNFYGAGSVTVALPEGGEVTLTQATEYPFEGRVELTVGPDQPREFTLSLRIPAWSEGTRVAVNGEAVPAEAGIYCELRREWQPGDQVEIELDMSLRYWAGQEGVAGKVALYRGPLLLAYDQRLNPFDPYEVPTVDGRALKPRSLSTADLPYPQPLLLLEVDTVEGQPLVLCDFASAGATGNFYRSWLPAQNLDESYAGPFARGD